MFTRIAAKIAASFALFGLLSQHPPPMQNAEERKEEQATGREGGACSD
jgi:hypothetical protein